jgi:hypothetical protein
MPAPGQGILDWAASNPGAVQEAMQRLQQLLQMYVQVVPSSATTAGTQSLIFGSNKVTLQIPLQFEHSVDNVATGATLATTIVALNDLLAQLRYTRQNPS